jgi:predicted negative regulator of RcsB-dependent stress response
VDDFLTERDQWEALKAWLRENGAWMVAGVIIGVAGLFGYRWWDERQSEQAHTAQARYQDVLAALTRNDKTRAAELADQLKKDFGGTPYSDQAQLVLARSHVESLELDAANRRLSDVMENSRDEALRLVARERMARVQLAQNRPDEALKTLAGGSPGAFKPRFDEIRGDALLRKGDTAGAIAAYREALAGAEPGVVDAGQLQLKLNDLGAAQPAPEEIKAPPPEEPTE